MTAVDQDAAAEKAVRELERRVRIVAPPSLLADPAAFAAAFIRWLDAEHWRCLPPPPDPIRRARQPADPPNDEWRAARAALERTDP